MSGPQLVALVAAVVAVAALVGVVLLLGQLRRLRRQVAATAPAPPATPATPQPLVDGPARVPATSRSLVDGPARLTEPVGRPTPVVELVMRPETGGPAPASNPVPTKQQVVAATLVHPLVRVWAFGHGVRRAMRPDNRDRLRALVRRDLRRRHKVRRAAARRAARVVPIRSAGTDDREESAS